jgi:hypothetical protein
MRVFLFLLFLSSGAWAQTTLSAFPVQHISYVDSGELLESTKAPTARVVVVVSDGSCLWQSFPARSCFLFERKLDEVGVEIKKRGWQLLGIDVGFRNLEVLEAFPINQRPSVLLIEDGTLLAVLEPDRNKFLSWQDELAQRVLSIIQDY